MANQHKGHNRQARDAHGGNHGARIVRDEPPHGGKRQQRNDGGEDGVDERLLSVVQAALPFRMGLRRILMGERSAVKQPSL